MPELTDLLNTKPLEPSQPNTLNDTISLAAEEWTTETIQQIVEGLRAQSARWNDLQQNGSRKRLTSKNVNTNRNFLRKTVL
jgi:hypothetical protein